jgi:predicted nucleic acid-binding protein
VFPVSFDTCVLFKAYVCDSILTIAESGLFRPLWSEHVLKELTHNLVRRGMTDAQVEHRVNQMSTYFPDAIVAGYDDLIDSMANDPKDRHVLAAAIRGGAELLVTENLRDFPESARKPYDLAAVNQDDFLLDQLDLAPQVVLESLRRQASRYRREPRTVADLLDVLSSPGNNCSRFAAACRAFL